MLVTCSIVLLGISLDSSGTPVVSCQLQGTFPRPLAKAVLTFDRTSSSKFLSDSGANWSDDTTRQRIGKLRKHPKVYKRIAPNRSHVLPAWDRPDWLADVLPGGSTLPNHPVTHWRRTSRSHMTLVSLTGSVCPSMQHCDSVFLISKSSNGLGRITQTLKIEQNKMRKIGKAMESCWKGRLILPQERRRVSEVHSAISFRFFKAPFF